MKAKNLRAFAEKLEKGSKDFGEMARECIESYPEKSMHIGTSSTIFGMFSAFATALADDLEAKDEPPEYCETCVNVKEEGSGFRCIKCSRFHFIGGG